MGAQSFSLDQFVSFHGSRLALLGLIALVVICGTGAKLAHLPAAWLIAPLVVSAIFAVRDIASVKLGKPCFYLIQSIIGVALASSFSTSSLIVLSKDWAPVLFVVLTMQIFTIINALFFVLVGKLSPATALLGTLPGGAGEMAAISETFGADARMVSVMQYTRLLVIIAMVSLGSSIVGPEKAVSSVVNGLSTGLNTGLNTAVTAGLNLGASPLAVAGILPLIVAVTGAFIGIKLRVPAGTMIVPMFLAIILNSIGIKLRWSDYVLWATYAALGLQIGSQFDAGVVERMKHLALSLVGASVFLMVGSMLLAVIFSHMIALDGASAYLAATPGGLDSVAVIATEMKADSAIVLTVHFARLVLVLTTGPILVRFFTHIMTKHLLEKEARESSTG